MARNFYVKHAGVWKPISVPYIKQSGVWKTPTAVFIKNSGSWKQVWPSVVTVEYLIVGGGGGGSGAWGGGGGAGGLLTNVGGSLLQVPTGSPIAVTVGAGSIGDAGNSTFYNLSAYGGGGSVQAAGQHGGDGGSGGGALYQAYRAGYGVYPGSPYKSEPRQGYDGYFSAWGGGGGGAGGASTGYDGGPGIASAITGTSVMYAAGGGSGAYVGILGDHSADYGVGGSGIGGNGGGYGRPPTTGAANTGSGGGGGYFYYNNYSGASGADGVVIVRYPDTYPNAISTTGSPAFSTIPGYKIYKWTNVGSWTITFG